MEYNVSTPRNESKPKGFGLHSNRGKVMEKGKAPRSLRRGSGMRRHLGDGITNTSTKSYELAERFAALKSKKKD